MTETKIAKVEEEAQLHMMMEHPALWRVINPNVKGPFGYPVGYEIAPGHNAISLMSDDDYPQRRAGFINHHLWVTPYREDERYAAAIIRRRATAATACRRGPRRTGRSRTPTSWCGTRWASTT